MFNRPGLHTSEFLVAAANLVGQVVMALNGTVSDQQAVQYTLAGAIAYIVSRGLAKFETRTTSAPPPTTPPNS